MMAPAHVAEMLGTLPVSVPMTEQDLGIERRLDAQVDALRSYDGYDLDDDPSINIPEVLRFRRLLKCYDMRDIGRYRYDMLQLNKTSGSRVSLRRRQAREVRSLALPFPASP